MEHEVRRRTGLSVRFAYVLVCAAAAGCAAPVSRPAVASHLVAGSPGPPTAEAASTAARTAPAGSPSERAALGGRWGASPEWSALAQSEADPEPEPKLRDRFWAMAPRFEIGAGVQLFAEYNTELIFQNDLTGNEERISLEDDLGFSTTAEVLRVAARFRFGRRHHLDASWFKIDRSSTKTIETEIEIPPDISFPIDAELRAATNIDVLKLAYRFSYFQAKRWDAAFSVGLHTMIVNTSFQAENLPLSAKTTVPLPVPVVGLDAKYAFTPRMRLGVAAQVFAIQIEQVGGFLLDSSLGFDYDFTRYFGIGVGLNYFDMNADVSAGPLGLGMKWQYLGALLSLRFFV